MNVSPEEFNISVYDEIRIGHDWNASFLRSYTFTNLSDKSASVKFSFVEKLHSSYEDFHPIDRSKLVEYLVHRNKQYISISWTIQISSLGPGQAYAVQFKGVISPFATIETDGLHCQHAFAPATRMTYSADILFPYEGFLRYTDVLVQPKLLSGPDYLLSDDYRRLTVSSRICAKNIPGFAEICLKSKPLELPMAPMLEYYSKKVAGNKRPFDNTCVLIILHVLSDFHSLIAAFESVGMKPENTFVVAIPYSAKGSVISVLQHKGYRNIWFTPYYEKRFDGNVEQALLEAIEHSKRTSKRIVILQDGGYASTLWHSCYRSDANICLGAVEQTRNGIWECQQIPEENRLFPVIDVASCWLKDKIEPPFIGDAVAHNIQSLISKISISLRERNVLLIGYGTIGKCVAKSLRGYGAKITVFDKDPESLRKARGDGFKIANALEAAIPHKKLIIGCTGRYRLSAGELALADNGTILVNASSKHFEVNHEDLKALTRKCELIEDYGSRHTLVNGRILDLLAEGNPVNFYGPSESVPDNEIQFISALLFLMALELVEKGDTLPRSIISVPDDVQNDIEKMFTALRL